ncbi:MAG: phosphoserine transaminase [Maricaulaceae bacterium]
MTAPAKPAIRPADPRFSSGPTRKRPGWSLDALSEAALGRNHRSPAAVAKFREAVERTRDVLQIPDDYRVAITPGSDTGAVEMAMWCLLGSRPVDVLAWEAFSRDWVVDAVEELKLEDLRVMVADYGQLPALDEVRADADVVFPWNGTTSGVRVPNADWIAADRAGLTICDATSACFCQELDWSKLDATTFSWQKVMGGEAAHGVLILSPRAIERLASFRPERPIPKLFRMWSDAVVNEAFFDGQVINTPSLLAVEDYIDALKWAQQLGGLPALIARADASAKVLYDWIAATDGVEPLCEDPAARTNTGVCLRFTAPEITRLDPEAQAKFAVQVAGLLAQEGVAFDIANYRTAPPGLRVWCGSMVETDDVQALLPWIEWAYATVKAEL